jgi:hypothetical protein
MTKKGSKRNRKDPDVAKVVNEIGYEVEQVLKSHNEEKYFEEIILLYSLIENLLKFSVFVKIFWGKVAEKELSKEEAVKLSGFCWRLSFYDALNIGLSLDVIDFDLYKAIEKVKDERNDVIHQLWIYEHRRNPVELKKQLEMLARVGKQLAAISARLTNQIGVEELLKIRLS